MDNNHYFGLYLIRIKHGLVLFSLSLIAFQSLIYLFLAIFSEKVYHMKENFFENFFFLSRII
jgi:hypothetical protein